MHAQSKWHAGCKTGKYIICFSYQNVYTKEILVGKVSQTGTPCNLFFCSGGSGGGARGPCLPPPRPLILDHTEARRAEKFFFETGHPFISGSGQLGPLLIWRSGSPLFRDLFRQVGHIQQNLDEAGSVTYKMIKMLWIGLTVWPVSFQSKCVEKMLLAL